MKINIIAVIASVMVSVAAFGQTQVPVAPTSGGDTTSASNGGGTSSMGTVSSMPADLAFLSSLSTLYTYAAESVRFVELQEKSKGMLYAGASTSTGWSTPKSEVEVMNEFNKLKMSLQMVNVADEVKASAVMYDTDWDIIFTAQSSGIPQLVAGGYRLDPMFFGFTLSTNFSFKIKGITMARFRYTDENGRTISDPIDLPVYNGKITIPSDFSGKGQVELRDKDGNTYIYDLRNNGKQSSIQIVSTSQNQSFIEGLYPISSTSSVDWQIWSWNGVGQNPAFEYTAVTPVCPPGYTCVPVPVQFHLHTTEGAEAIGYNVRLQGTEKWNYWSAGGPVGSKHANITFSSGIWYVVPVWNPDEFRERDPIELPAPIEVIPGKG